MLDERRNKLDAKAIKYLFVGYRDGTKAYRLICLDAKNIIRSRNVAFFKDKLHLEESPNRSDEGPAFEVDNSSKLDDEGDLEEEFKLSMVQPVLIRSLKSTIEEKVVESHDEVAVEVVPKQTELQLASSGPSKHAKGKTVASEPPPNTHENEGMEKP